MRLFPILIDVEDKLCVVVGGGKVALRKARTLLDRGGRTRVVSPVLAPELKRLASRGGLEWERREYRNGDLDGAFLAVAATDSAATNQAVRAEANRRGVLVNLADDSAGGDFMVPSFFESGPLLVAVSTSGESPAVARTLRRMIQAYLGDSFGPALELIGQFREETVKTAIPAGADRLRFWEIAVTASTLELARQGDLEAVQRELEQALRAFLADDEKP